MVDCEYVAIKVTGLDFWIWFEEKNIKRQAGRFIGTGGWGKGGIYTEINIPEQMILGTIHSKGLQYE